MSHTKGEWKHIIHWTTNWTHPNTFEIYCEDDGHRKCIADGQYWSTVPIEDEVTANAKLISAAPDLLDALEDLMDHENKQKMSLAPDSRLRIKVYNAIAKAKGEKQIDITHAI